HYDGNLLAGYLDVGSMFFFLYTSLVQIIRCILFMFQLSYTVSEMSISTIKTFSFLLQFSSLGASLLSIAAFYTINDLQLPILFGIPGAIFWIIMLIWSIFLYKHHMKAPYRYVISGLILSLLGTIIWMLTETRCTKDVSEY